jgi:hypothetical protein
MMIFAAGNGNENWCELIATVSILLSSVSSAPCSRLLAGCGSAAHRQFRTNIAVVQCRVVRGSWSRSSAMMFAAVGKPVAHD